MAIDPKDLQGYKDGLSFYQERLTFYEGCLNDPCKFCNPDDKTRGFGVISFMMDRRGCQFMYEHWLTGMIEFIQNETSRIKRDKQGKKNKKKDS